MKTLVKTVPLGFLIPSLTAETLPVPLNAYGPSISDSLVDILFHRVSYESFNLIASIIFVAAIIHTFLAPFFQNLSHKFSDQTTKDKMLHVLFHFLGEVEVIFGLWVIPLVISMFIVHDWRTVVHYFETVNYVEPMFVVVIMAIAASQPILFFARACMNKIAALGHNTPRAWWFSILIIGPLLGSVITEPAAITISALLLGKQFYDLQPSMRFRYATLGLLFVNVSVGGVLTHFAAPPILMVAHKWGWDTPYMLSNFGIHALVGIIVATLVYGILFRAEFKILQARASNSKIDQETMPWWIIAIHLLFLVWTIFTLHTPALFIFGFLFFLGFVKITAVYQFPISLKSPILIGFFLAGLVTHGGLQQWWIEALLGKMNETCLFLGAAVLTAFNDNAAIAYLSTLVPEISASTALQHAVILGALTGGGLTVIANAPNPAGQAILQKYFPEKISPMRLFFGAIIPTLILGITLKYL